MTPTNGSDELRLVMTKFGGDEATIGYEVALDPGG